MYIIISMSIALFLLPQQGVQECRGLGMRLYEYTMSSRPLQHSLAVGGIMRGSPGAHTHYI